MWLLSFHADDFSWLFFALSFIPPSKYYSYMWDIWASIICFLLFACAKLNNSTLASHQERVKSRRDEAQQALLPIWSGKQNVSMSQIGAEIVSLPVWACSPTEKQKPCLKPVSILSKAENWCIGTTQALCFQTEAVSALPAVRLPIYLFFFQRILLQSEQRSSGRSSP